MNEKMSTTQQATARPKNSFLMFSDDKRNEIKLANPGIKSNEIAKIVGKMWAESTEEVKETYRKKYSNIKSTLPPKPVPEKKAPTRKRSNYNMFCGSEIRQKIKSENPNITPKDMTCKLAEIWRSLSLEEKGKYEDTLFVPKDVERSFAEKKCDQKCELKCNLEHKDEPCEKTEETKAAKPKRVRKASN